MNLTMTAILAANVTLAWDSVSPVEHYTLYTGIQPITAGNLPSASYDTTDTFFTVGGLVFGTQYYFVVTSWLGGLESTYSNEVQYVPIATTFAIGNRIQVVSSTNVRSAAGLPSPLIGTQSTGAIGTLLEGPLWMPDGFIWWRVDFDSAPDGWCGEDNFALVSPTPTPTPTPEPTPTPDDHPGQHRGLNK